MQADNVSLRTMWVGRRTWDDVYALQLELRDAVIAGSAPATLLLVEHEPVITLGRRQTPEDLRVPTDELERRGIALRAAERGGRATYHGPGQLVGYPVVQLHDVAPGIGAYVSAIEEAMIRAAARFSVTASRREGLRGVWVGERKLGFVGVAVTRGVCWHGFSLNVAPDMTGFDVIVPCGLDVAVTSIAQHTCSAPEVAEVGRAVAAELTALLEPIRRVGVYAVPVRHLPLP
jgi:lipoate-protein ligase B